MRTGERDQHIYIYTYIRGRLYVLIPRGCSKFNLHCVIINPSNCTDLGNKQTNDTCIENVANRGWPQPWSTLNAPQHMTNHQYPNCHVISCLLLSIIITWIIITMIILNDSMFVCLFGCYVCVCLCSSSLHVRHIRIATTMYKLSKLFLSVKRNVLQ